MSSGTDLQDKFANLDQDTMYSLKRGYEIAGTLPPEKLDELISLVLSTLGGGGGPLDLSPFAEELGTSRTEMSHLLQALVVSVTVIAESNVSGDEFASIIANGIIDSRFANTARHIASRTASERHKLDGAIRRDKLANSVLPSLVEYYFSVDARFRFAGDLIEDAAPVLIARITTDLDEDFCFQITSSRLKDLLVRLQQRLEQMEIVEKFVAQVRDVKK